MNCKPGDLARIVHPALYGKFVDVLYAAPTTDYTLPDGYLASPNLAGEPEWVCAAHGAPFDAPLRRGGARKARYAGIKDKWLRPIRGLDETADERESAVADAGATP